MYGCCGAPNTCAAGPDSTIRPAYMTASRSHDSASTARSWLIRISASPSSARSRSSRSSTCACMITSSAVVGSSAITSAGRQASAKAIMARWRWPPESWCGYARPCVEDSPTVFSSSAIRPPTLPRLRLVQLDRLEDLAVDALDRVEGVHRALEDERDVAPAHELHPALGPAVDPDRLLGARRVQRDRPARHQRRRQQLHDRQRRRRLAAARLAGQPERLARLDSQVDAGHDRLPAVADLEALDLQQAQVRSRSRGLTCCSNR